MNKRGLVAHWLSNQISVQMIQDRFSVRENMYLIFSSDIVNLLLKTNAEETEGLIIFIFVLVAWSRKSCLGPAKIGSFVFLVLFKDGGCRVGLRFYLFVSDVNQARR